jgi:hypothetical protein
MDVPLEIQRLASEGLSSANNNPLAHFDWQIRREMYRKFRTIVGNEPGKQVHGWLSVISAEYVLPIFKATFSDDPLPERLIRYAKRVLEGRISADSQRLILLEDQGYMGTGIDMLDLRDGRIAYDAEYAGNTAYKALVEVRNKHILLERVETLRRDKGYLIMGGGSTSAEFDHLENGITFKDEDIAHLAAFSDTASTAAIAYACESQSFTLSREKLRKFWQWWVSEALPKAWGYL